MPLSTSSQTKYKKAILPIGALFLLLLPVTKLRDLIAVDDSSLGDLANSNLEEWNIRTIVRTVYAAYFTVAMEYIATYQHKYLWHSRWLWFIHATHHHQEAKFGDGPSKSDAESRMFKRHDDAFFELNDVFPVFFASISMLAIAWSMSTPLSLAKDCVLGTGVGISLYGTSYFIGHDLIAHERAGKRFASTVRYIFPYVGKCAEYHMINHHKIDVNADDRKDPYGEPYGFWLGPQGLQVQPKESEGPATPTTIKLSFILLFLFWCVQCFQIV